LSEIKEIVANSLLATILETASAGRAAMDEISARMFKAYEAWKIARGEVDALMQEMVSGIPIPDGKFLHSVALMHEAWSEFEVASEPRFRKPRS
jgi:hypothetical protein